MQTLEKRPLKGPYKPALILHGGAGALSRQNVSPEVYNKYYISLLKFLTSARECLDSGASALDAACHAVSMFEDDMLFNCGRGSVFTREGTIEMEASVMVTSVDPSDSASSCIKRASAVSLVQNTRHPILLAKEVLMQGDEDNGRGGPSTMHCHLSGRDVEEWGWKSKGLERKEFDWFWTKERWEQHRRGLERGHSQPYQQHIDMRSQSDPDPGFPSQGTVGAVCIDSWGNLCVATSTGGLTNKASGRIGDTPTVGAGFWAERWDEAVGYNEFSDNGTISAFRDAAETVLETIRNCFPTNVLTRLQHAQLDPSLLQRTIGASRPWVGNSRVLLNQPCQNHKTRSRAVAMSGTGNGDSFLRTNAVRSVAALCRYVSPNLSLAQSVTRIAGPDGELQKSAGNRWTRTGEGEGGIIGIEARYDEYHSLSVETVYDFNCGGMWRAWYTVDPDTGIEVPRIMVFKDEY